MTEATLFSLPPGVTGLRAAAAGHGRIAAVSNDDRAFAWDPASGWRALDGQGRRIVAVYVHRAGVSLVGERLGALGFWDAAAGSAVSWTTFTDFGPFDPLVLDGEAAVRQIHRAGRARLEVLFLRDGRWIPSCGAEASDRGELTAAWQRPDGMMSIGTEEGLFTLDPLAESPRLEEVLRWRGPTNTLHRWVRFGDRILVETHREPVTMIDLKTGEVESRGVPFLPGHEPLLEKLLSGDREGLERDVEFLTRIPWYLGSRPVKLLATLSGPLGPVAAATSEGVVLREALVGGPALDGETAAWRFLLRPDATLSEVVGFLVDLSWAATMSVALRERYGTSAVEMVLATLDGGQPLRLPVHPHGFVAIAAHAGPACREVVLAALGSRSRPVLAAALVFLRAEEACFREELATAGAPGCAALGKLLAHPAEEIRFEAVRTVGSLGLVGFLDDLERLAEDDSTRVRREVVTTLVALKEARALVAPILVDRMRNDLDEEVRALTLDRGELLDDPVLAEAIVTALRDVSKDVRAVAARVLAERAGRLIPGSVRECVDGILLNLVAARLAPVAPHPGQVEGRELDFLFKALGKAAFEGLEHETPDVFLGFPVDRQRACLGFTLVLVEGRGFLLDDDTEKASIREFLETLAGVAKRSPDETVRRLMLGPEETSTFLSGRWGNLERIALARRISNVDASLGDRLVTIALLGCRPGTGRARPVREAGPPPLHERLRAIGADAAPMEWAHGRVREIARRRSPEGLLALLALVRYEDSDEARHRLRAVILSGETVGCEAFLALALPFLPSGDARALVVSFLQQVSIPLDVRVRAEDTLARLEEMDGIEHEAPDYEMEFVTSPRIPAEYRRERARRARPHRRETLTRAFWTARESERELSDEERQEKARDLAELGGEA